MTHMRDEISRTPPPPSTASAPEPGKGGKRLVASIGKLVEQIGFGAFRIVLVAERRDLRKIPGARVLRGIGREIAALVV